MDSLGRPGTPARHLRVVPAAGEGARDSGTVAAPPPAPRESLPSAGPIDLDQAFRMYSRLVASIGFRILGRRGEVEDLVQDVFVEAGKWATRIDDPSALKHWLITVTVRAARHRLRRARFATLLGFGTPVSYDDIAGSDASPSERTLLAQVYRVLDRLPVNDRLAWTLRHVQGESLAEVATLCGCSVATAKRRISAAHEAIQEALSDE
ncbi:MAG TPA: sigma-70 family RNA polymerase sigma factor [Polyangiaceae bacterium]|jgi:RNA polymerase sigma-70 factor (ECF subfamily)